MAPRLEPARRPGLLLTRPRGGQYPCSRSHARGLDSHRSSALCLSVHIACLRPAISAPLLQAMLESGTPVDARHEDGRTALMLAANNGRLDLCSMLLDAMADAPAVRGFHAAPPFRRSVSMLMPP